MTESEKPFSLLPNLLRALIALVTLVLFITLTSPALAGPAPQTASEGEAIFREKCMACHTIGGGDGVGPDLKGVTARRSKEWLTHWIPAPDQVLASGDPIATELLKKYNNVPMPNLGLTQEQATSLIAFLEQADAQGLVVTKPTPATPTGRPDVGKAYFTGNKRFENGGPPCMGCHSIAGIGALGGGALGPDLTPAFNKYGDAGLANFLNNTPTVTMSAVWKQKPLTPQEQADLYAFLKEASVSGRSVQALFQIALLAIGGAIVLIVLAQLYWGRRLTGVRQPMLRRTYAAVKNK